MGFEERSDIYSEIRTEHMDETGAYPVSLQPFQLFRGLGMLLCFCLCMCVWGVDVNIKTLNKHSLTNFLGCMFHWVLGDFISIATTN